MKKEYKLSICMIVRDEEKFIDNCLKSLKPLLDLELAELIIVDTGSIDNTVEISKKYTNKVYFKKWNNNFSEARNYSISFAKGEYIFIMDADQDMEKEEIDKLIKLFSSEEYKKYNTYSIIYKNFTSEDLKNYNYSSLNLIFKNDGSFKYDGRIHNQPIYKEPVKNLYIYMNHYGYIMTEDIKDKKFKRTATLLKEELEKDPTNIYYIYQLSRSYEMHGDNKEAILEVEKYMKLIQKANVNNISKLPYYHNAMIIYFNSKNYDKCIYYCMEILKIDKELIDAYYIMGICYKIKGNIDKAIINFKLYLKYLKNFNYKKYMEFNVLEICTHEDKPKVIMEIINLKFKINQLDNIEKYIEEFGLDDERIYLIVDKLIKIYIQKNDINKLNELINKAFKENEKELLIYQLSYILGEYNNINLDNVLSKLYILTDNDKNNLRERVLLQKKSRYLNLIEFIKENSDNKKEIKIENCIETIIESIEKTQEEEILNSNYYNEIIFIIKYLIEKVNILAYQYLIDKNSIYNLVDKYIKLIEKIDSNNYKEDKIFVEKLKEFKDYYTNKDIKKCLLKLKEAIVIIPEFVKLIELIKESSILDKKDFNLLISEKELLKIKENLVVLINNNLINNTKEIIYELENMYDIRQDVELINIKAIINIYLNNLKEAEEILKEGLKYYFNNIDLLCNLAYIYEIKNQNLSALSIYNQILSLNRDIDKEKIYEDINRVEEKIEII